MHVGCKSSPITLFTHFSFPLLLSLSCYIVRLSFVITLMMLNFYFKGALDLSKVTVAGHSFGGCTALKTLAQDKQFKYVFSMLLQM